MRKDYLSQQPREVMETSLQEHLPNVDVVAHARDERGRAVTSFVNKPGITVCDFCNATPAPTIFPCPNTWVETMVIIDEGGTRCDDYESLGGWGACDPCAQDIRAQRRGAVLERALRAMLGKDDEMLRAKVASSAPPGTPQRLIDRECDDIVRTARKMTKESIKTSHDAFWTARPK